jgi:DNA-binding MarR family transcriptional regulator
MKKMNKANLSPGEKEEKDVFTDLVELVFIFIHEHYRAFNEVLGKYQINYSQYAALLSVYMYESLSEGDLARMLYINPSTVSRMVYALEEKGWLQSTRDKADRRKVIISLSPTGKKRIDGIVKQPALVLARLANGLDKEKRDYVYSAAEFINQALRYLAIEGSNQAT